MGEEKKLKTLIAIGDLCLASNEYQKYLELTSTIMVDGGEFKSFIFEVKIREITAKLGCMMLSSTKAVEKVGYLTNEYVTQTKPAENLEAYQTLMQSLMLIGSRLETVHTDIQHAMKVYMLMSDHALPVNKASILLKIAKLYI